MGQEAVRRPGRRPPGVGIGPAGGGEQERTDPAAKPQPTVTVTETVEPKADDKPADPPAEEAEEAAAGEVVFKVWGSAPAGVDIDYGSDSDSRSGGGLPMTKTLKPADEALSYQVNAQLMGGGDINCSVTVEGETKKGHASGDYNIRSARLSGGFLGGLE